MTIAVGGVEPIYAITICDAFGLPLLRPKDWQALEYSLVENAFGRARLTLPGYYDRELFKKDGLLVVERGLGNASPALLAGKSIYRIRGRRRKQIAETPFFDLEIRGVDLTEVLARRFVDYNAGSAYVSKSDFADDMLKAIVRENFGSLATDTTRSIASYLTVAADAGAAPSISKSFSRRNVLKVAQEIASASLENGTYLAFDVVATAPPTAGVTFAPEFRTYTGQRGLDHRVPGGSPPVLIGPDFGNLDNVEIDEDWEAEATRVIVGGQGEAELRAIARADDTGRQGESPWGLIEHFEDSRNTSVSADLTAEAQALLKMMRPRKIATGRVRPTSGLLLGVHYGFGDFLTFQAAGESFDAHLSGLVVNKQRDGGETIDVVLRTED